MIKVSGGVKDLLDFSLKKQKIIYGSFGAYDGNPIDQLSYTKTTTNKTWSYTGSFPYVNSVGYHAVGCAVHVTIGHGTTSYTGVATNYI